MKRLFTLALGLGAGLLVGAWVVRRIEEAKRAVAPSAIAGRAGRAAGSLASRLREGAEEGRRAAAEHEAELRARFAVPSVRDTLGG